MSIFVQQYDLFNAPDDEMHIFVCENMIMVYTTITRKDDIINAQSVDHMECKFKYDENNHRIPYHNDIRITCLKLTTDQNPINYISSAKLIPDDQIICGELFQSLADVVVGAEGSLIYNPYNERHSKSMVSIDALENLDQYKSIFVFTHDLEAFYAKFEGKLSDKIILSHNSDGGITYVKDVKLHMAQNCHIRNERLYGVPIGIENAQWIDHTMFNRVRKLNIPKTKQMYFYFNFDTHPSRHDCYNALVHTLEWNTQRTKEDYLIELARHKYAICPRGNGLDTHRIWECIYLNVIPIVVRSDYPNIDNLPIIVLNHWNEIDSIDASFDNQEYEKITINHYRNRII